MAGTNLGETPEQWVWLARIRRPQGRKGEVFAEILTDFPEKFAERRRLWLLRDLFGEVVRPPHRTVTANPEINSAPAEIELKHHWLHKDGIVLHFAGIDSISDAETLAGLVVAVPRSERILLSEDEVYIGDLIGCTLMDVARGDAGIAVGIIENVERSAGAAPLLIVSGGAGQVLVPFAKSYLRKIDVDARRVEMALPEGLVELNAPEGS